MAAKAPRVVRKVKIEGKWIFANVVKRNGNLDFGRVLYKGQEIRVSAGTFYLDYGGGGKGRRRPAIGDDPAAVKRALVTQTHVIELRRRGVEIDDAPELQGNGRIAGKPIRSVVAEFDAHPPARLSRKSAAKYSNALRTFASWGSAAGFTHVPQVDGRVMNLWMRHMRDVEGLDASTIRDKVIIVAPELRKHGAEIVLRTQDMPKVTEREVDIYKPDTLRSLFHACKPHEFLLYQTFLQSGMREQELSFLSIEDLDEVSSTLRVSKKLDLGFDLKNYQERTIPVPRWLMELLALKKRSLRQGARLLFETSEKWAERGVHGGKRDKKMLIKLKSLAKRAGLNCGHCVGTWDNKPVTCATHPVCGKFTLHRFRHTFATMMLRDMDIVSVSKLLGHRNVNTTRRYLRSLEASEMQAKIEVSALALMFA